MGRHISMAKIPAHYPSFTSNYPSLSLSFHVTCMAFLIAAIGGLCGRRSRKNEASEEKETNKAINASTIPLHTPSQRNTIEISKAPHEVDIQKSLPLPPAVVALELGEGDGVADWKIAPKIDRSSTLHNYMSKSASRRKLSGSISMKISGATSMGLRLEDPQKKLKHEDSIWTKKILLGEKCRLPTEDVDEDGLRDIREKEVTKVTVQSQPVSRTNSSVDQEAGPS
ncbi:hypothetical protein Dimus_020683 [Dionaea muscipula]